ncbi:MAG: lanthionine synthetase C family protein, partial [Blastocatellia bacterium]
LNEAIDEAAERLDSVRFFGGFTEIGWVIANLSEILFDQDEAEGCVPVDEMLNEFLDQWEGELDYDLIVGLVGYGVYALERREQSVKSSSEISTKIINKLWDTAKREGQHITWHTSPTLLPEWQRQICPNGYYNLGLAHGVPGVIALLGRNISVGVETERSQHLLEGTVRWLLAQRNPADSESYFSSWAGPGIEREASKVAWCYGDLGLGMALLYAAQCVGQADWEREAIEVLLKAAARPFESADVFDVCLCHGAAGNAHIFNRAYQATGNARFREAALAWYERALAFQRPGEGIGGFSIREMNDAGTEAYWVNQPGLLDGIAGVALSLLAACTNLEPNWDRSLLISIPPKST